MAEPISGAAFDSRDAAPLAHAYVHAVAAQEGVRLLTIKGPASEHFRLREPRPSADADVLAEPSGFAALVEALTRNGWQPRPLPLAEVLPHHAVSLMHPSWPCDLDVHRSFPGFLKPPTDVFEALWAEHASIECAGRATPVPSESGSILITALHTIRSPAYEARHPEELDRLIARLAHDFTSAQSARLAALSIETGCLGALDGALVRLGVPPPGPGVSRELREWRARRDSHWNGSSLWLSALAASPTREYIRRMRMALWPDDAYMAASHPELMRSAHTLRSARLRRLVRGVRDLPSALVTRLRSRRRRR